MCQILFQKLEFVHIDGHISHMSSSFIELYSIHGLQVITVQSHPSIILQVADVGVNCFPRKLYEYIYPSFTCLCNGLGRIFGNVERFGCVVRTVNELRKQPGMIAR